MFHIEETLRKTMKVPVFHDDQHGTAIVSGAALLNALEVVGKFDWTGAGGGATAPALRGLLARNTMCGSA